MLFDFILGFSSSLNFFMFVLLFEDETIGEKKSEGKKFLFGLFLREIEVLFLLIEIKK
jgi:hypothetical protein